MPKHVHLWCLLVSIDVCQLYMFDFLSHSPAQHEDHEKP